MGGSERMVMVAEAIDEDPSRLYEHAFRDDVVELIASTNGDFVARAAGLGIDQGQSEAWLKETEQLARADTVLEVEGAADLAVRLYALGYVLADGGVPNQSKPEDLLTTAEPLAEAA